MDELYTLSRSLLKAHNKAYSRSFLEQKPFSHRFTILLGERGVGKTTVIAQYLSSQNKADEDSVLYVQADHFLVNKYSLYSIAENFYSLGGKIICFDEIHKYRNWSTELKSIYDTFTNLNIIASGSSALEIIKGSHDLSRRAIVKNLRGFSLREYIELKYNTTMPVLQLQQITGNHVTWCDKIIMALQKATQKKILRIFKDYLECGYYPYFNEINDLSIYKTIVQQSLHAFIEADLPAIYPTLTGASVHKIIQLLSYIASAVPLTPDMRKLRQTLDIGDERTLKNYLSFMKNGEVISILPFAGGGLGRVAKNGKIYLGNTNQLFAINQTAVNSGTIRETFFNSMLSHSNSLAIPEQGDFLVNNQFLFEVGGKNKNFSQIKDLKNSFTVVDDIEAGYKNKIPLWIFGFVY